MNWWWISPSENLREQVKDLVHLLEQVGFMEKDEAFGNAKFSVFLEKRFGDKFIVFTFNKKLFVTVIGLSREEQADGPMRESQPL
jgi:hypothetical protein